MNWQDDPALRAAKHRAGVHGRMVRSAIIWTPLFAVVAVLLIWFFIDTAFNGGDGGGTWVLVVVLTVLTGLFGYQSIQAILDLRDTPRVERGRISRRWARTDSFVMKSHYIRLGGAILRGDAYQLAGMQEGDYVEVTYYPHSAVIVWAEKLPAPVDEAAGAAPEA